MIKQGSKQNVRNYIGKQLNVDQRSININVSDPKYIRGLFRRFATFNLEFFKWLSMQKLTGRQWRVLAYCIGKMQTEARITITYKEIYTNLNIAQPNLSSDINKLIDKKIILKQKLPNKKYEIKLNLNNMYLNPNMAYNGGSKDKAAIQEHKQGMIENTVFKELKNLWGDYDLQDNQTGQLMPGNKKIANEHPVKNKKPILIEPTQDQKNDRERIRELELKISEMKDKIKELNNENNELESSPRKAVGVWSTAKELAENHYKITAENELQSKIISEKAKQDPNFHNDYVAEILKIMQEEKKAKKRRDEIKLKAEEHKKMQPKTH